MMKKTIFAAGIAAIAAAATAQDYTFSRGSLQMKKATDESLAAAVAAHPDAKSVTIMNSTVSSFAPFAKLEKLETLSVTATHGNNVAVGDIEALAALKNLESLTLSYVKLDEKDLTCLSGCTGLEKLTLSGFAKDRNTPVDITGLEKLQELEKLMICYAKVPDVKPLAGLAKLKSLSFHYAEVDDLTPLAGLPKVKELRFYDARVKDWTPLAGMKNLEELDFYASRVEGDKWDSLGSLKQVKKFNGGMNRMTSIAWVKELPQIEELKLFNDKIDDWTPLASAAKLEHFKAWKMKSPVDLAPLANLPELEKVELPYSEVKNFATLATLPKLEELGLSRMVGEVDLGVFKGKKTLKRVNVSYVKDAKGVGALADTGLAYLYVSKGQFPDAELDALEAARRAEPKTKRFKVLGR